jgi:hypothetical protein
VQPERAALARLVCELLAMAGVLWLGWAERRSGGGSGAGGEEWLRQLRRQLQLLASARTELHERRRQARGLPPASHSAAASSSSAPPSAGGCRRGCGCPGGMRLLLGLAPKKRRRGSGVQVAPMPASQPAQPIDGGAAAMVPAAVAPGAGNPEETAEQQRRRVAAEVEADFCAREAAVQLQGGHPRTPPEAGAEAAIAELLAQRGFVSAPEDAPRVGEQLVRVHDELGGGGGGESFLRVHRVAVPEAMRARRVSRRRQLGAVARPGCPGAAAARGAVRGRARPGGRGRPDRRRDGAARRRRGVDVVVRGAG